MNLCNSGLAQCYQSGNAVLEAVNLTKQYKPDVLSVNEICSPADTTKLSNALRAVWPNDVVKVAFAQVQNRDGTPKKCSDGVGNYGDAAIYHYMAGSALLLQRGGTYNNQDGSNEVRGWVCAGVKWSYMQCTTHLSATRAVAAKQCSEFTGSVVTQAWNNGNAAPTIESGDLNLEYGDSPYDAQDCVPQGWYRKGDAQGISSGVQHEIAQNSFVFNSKSIIPMTNTDHPALLVKYTRPAVTPSYDSSDAQLDSGEQLVSGSRARFPQDDCLLDTSSATVPGDPDYWRLLECSNNVFYIEHITVQSGSTSFDCSWRVGGTNYNDSSVLAMQPNGDLTFTNIETGQQIWHSGTSGHPGAYARLSDSTGILTIFSAAGVTLWTSAGEPHPC